MRAVREAARVCQNVQVRIDLNAMNKRDRSPVTVADFASQAIVCKLLEESFPDDPVVGEEDSAELRSAENEPFLDQVILELAQVGIDARSDEVCRWIDRGFHDGTAGRFWTLDPIDGTKGFLRKEQYAISLALIVDGGIKVAALCCPNLAAADAWDGRRGVIFSAVHGQGASTQPLEGPTRARQTIRVSSTSAPSAARLCESVESGHSAHGRSAQVAALLGISAPPVRLDSQAKYGVVARGEADIYLRLPTRADYREKIWDHAGGVLIVEEAGGRVTDVDGHSLDFTQGRELSNNRGVVVTNGVLHDDVIQAISGAQ